MHLSLESALLKPDFIKPFFPRWWWWKRCKVNVLIVTDGGLDFGTGGFGLSEFLSAFNLLQSSTWNDYKLTLAHRTFSVASSNPLVVNHINNFKFDTSVNLNDFDQVWLFGIDPSSLISANENNAIEAYMNNGGGLFATGDHGSLGKAMCGSIPRVKDMRHWDDFDGGEVSMGGARRNDTNRPAAGAATSRFFDNQSDNIPQNISARIFAGGIPHPLLSIKTSLRSSGVIDVMPDHPHEGECKQETTFTVNGVSVPTQIIATSFVLGGSTTANGMGKQLTQAHSFPSISVWNGRLANAGRIVVDSTWHHFVNINLNGEGSNGGDITGIQSGLNPSDLRAIKQYFMNIALWMTRRKSFLCWRRFILFDLLKNSQIIEATLNNPGLKRESISLADMNSIGSLAEELLAAKYNAAFAREILIDLVSDFNPSFANQMDIWKPESIDLKAKNRNQYHQPWINQDLILYTTIGAGFIALRDDKRFASDDISEKDLNNISEVFLKGLDYGLNISLNDLSSSIKSMAKNSNFKI